MRQAGKDENSMAGVGSKKITSVMNKPSLKFLSNIQVGMSEKDRFLQVYKSVSQPFSSLPAKGLFKEFPPLVVCTHGIFKPQAHCTCI